jgi:SHAQKYF class myb-like DNA-binding protein
MDTRITRKEIYFFSRSSNSYKYVSAENTFIQPEYANASNNYFPEVAQAVCLSDSSFVEVIRGTPWEYSTEQTQQKNKTPKRKKSSSKENLNQNDDPSVSPSKRSRRNWTDEEESRFMEALELFGRDWYKCAEYMETRDVVSCRSHAQKVFIKLWINGDPLPQKVAEQGSGYTVSGKPLDPDSSFVRYYISLFDKRRPSEENANF